MTQETGYAHAEAYCLMIYEADDGTEQEIIWNSRDGVTPFTITLRSGKQATHRHWSMDRRVVDYTPSPGDRIFVDLTLERAKEAATRIVDKYLAHPLYSLDVIERDGSREQAIERLASEYMSRSGTPDLVEVQS